MPTYDYHCDTCGREFEWFQSIKDPRLTHCPESVCQSANKGAGTVQRKISGGSGLIFNGDGFYLTDYVKNSSGKGSPSKSASSSESAANDSASEGSSTSGASSDAAHSASSSTASNSPSSSSSSSSAALHTA